MTKEDMQQLPRVKMHISCTWGATPDTPRTGIVSNLSRQGCFVQTKAAIINQGQRLYIKLWRPDDGWLELAGAVLYHMERIGFGLRFDQPPPEVEAALDRLIAQPPRPVQP